MKFTKLLSAILAALMLLGVCVAGISAEEKLPFTDVPKGEWYYDAVAYTYAAGLMNGTGDGTKFSPMINLTRGMVVTVLYRNDGAPSVNVSNPFTDITDGAWYGTAATWAYNSGVVTGTGTDEWGDPLFSPDRNITRQELAAMFARYAAYKHVDTAKNTTDITTFPDSGKVASWAEKEFKWTAGTGIITGKGGGGAATLSPEDLATRAEFAIMIQRYNVKDDAREFTYKLAYEIPVPNSQFTEKEFPLIKDADVYVAVDGNDSNPGTLEKPLATFEAAKAKVRELKKNATDEIVVAFKAGNYGELSVTFSADDAGTEKVPVTYRAYGDGEVIFSNGCLIDEAEFKPVDNNDLPLLGDVDTSKIKKVDLTGRFEKFSTRSALFGEDGLCHEARFPNKNDDGSDVYYSNMTTTVDDRSSIKLLGALPSIVESFKTTEGMRITGYLRAGWLVDTFTIKSYAPDTDIVTFDFENYPPLNYTLDQFPLMYEGRTTDMVFFHNLSDQIDSKGEYWFDENTKQLYIYEPDGDYAITDKASLIRIDSSGYLNFEGLTFTCSADTAVNSFSSSHLKFDGCTFRYVSGNQCIYTWGCDYVTVENSEFSNFVSGGVYVNAGGDINLLEECHSVVRNNYIHDFGDPKYFGGSGIAVQDNVGILVEHNHLVNGASGGIIFNGTVDAVIRYNVLDDMVNNTKDFGAVYGGGKARRGNKICYNLIMNMYDSLGKSRESYGIYIDECGSGQEVFGNIFYNGGTHAVTLNGGRENNLHDNIIINVNLDEYGGDFLMTNAGMYQLILDGTPELGKDHQTYTSFFIERPAEGEPGYDKWYARFPEVYDFNIDPANVGKPDCLFTTINFVKNNMIIGSEIKYGEIYDKFAEKENNVAYGLDVNPLFVDPTHGDYRFKESGKFFEIDFSKIGLQ